MHLTKIVHRQSWSVQILQIDMYLAYISIKQQNIVSVCLNVLGKSLKLF